MSRIEELRRLHEAATPGPWSVYCNHWVWRGGAADYARPGDAGGFNVHALNEDGPYDAALIAAMRNHIAELLDVAEALRVAAEKLDDIEDDAQVLAGHAPESLYAMILGIQVVAQQSRDSARAALARLAKGGGTT